MGSSPECIWSVRPGSSMQAALGEIQEGIDLPLYYGATLLLPPSSSSDPSDGDAPAGAVAALSLWAQTLGRQSAKN